MIAAAVCFLLAGCGRKAPPVWLEPDEFPAPRGLVAVFTEGGVSITWEFPAELKPFIRGYVVEALMNGVLVGSIVTHGTEYSDPEGGAYSYRVGVLGQRNGAKAGFSPAVASPSIEGLGPPDGLGAAMTAEGLKLSWKDMRGVDAYRVYRQIKGTGSDEKGQASKVKDTSFLDSNPEILKGQVLLYRVRAIRELNVDGVRSIAQGPASRPLETRDSLFTPDSPRGVDITASGGKVLVYWDESPEKWINGYRVYRSTPGGSFRKLGDSKVPAFKDIPEGSGEFAYRVHAMGPGGIEGPPGAVVRVSMPQGTVLK